MLSPNNQTIVATLVFDTSLNLTTEAGVPVSSVQVNLKYQGDPTYTPSSDSDDDSSGNSSISKIALIFSYGNIVPDSAYLDGSDKPTNLDPTTASSLLTKLTTDATVTSLLGGNSAGTIALLPTFEINKTATTSGLLTDVPSATVCFLVGAEIKTLSGLKKIEDIAPGEVIVTYRQGKEIPQKTTSICKKRVIVSSFEDYPVRIKAHALADNVPYNDLLLTEEHCIFLDGDLIPVRMLLNQHSIVRENSVRDYDIYHVECGNHEIICANGVYAETYLDTAHQLGHDGNLITIGRKTWARDAVAPLGARRDIAEPIWRKIAQRSGLTQTLPAAVDDPDLHIVTDTGMDVRPYRVREHYYLFMLPENIKHIHLVSRTFRPSDVIGPFIDDRRNLGVLVDDVRLFYDDECVTLETPFQDSSLLGWDVMEASHCRWTSGSALLPIGRTSVPCVLSLHVQQAGPYLAEGDMFADQSDVQPMMAA
ncbi:hypothetical protein GS501_00325 [Saccharibacter sp. 17.LH.SD]|uniref:Hint domain-containing protein n=1 Tax=Saccharibacter sp. 17.LH.SD TaxID=2689393 RepID=UPI0013711FAA|nr:hypothetical protein [Saccharibacter sp. 17.LH.SD]